MADYYPLIARAIEGLSDRSPEMRAAVYERARSALLGQLANLDPPLSPENIEAERVSLDAAIARIEQEQGAPKEPPKEPAKDLANAPAKAPVKDRPPEPETAPAPGTPLQEPARPSAFPPARGTRPLAALTPLRDSPPRDRAREPVRPLLTPRGDAPPPPAPAGSPPARAPGESPRPRAVVPPPSDGGRPRPPAIPPGPRPAGSAAEPAKNGEPLPPPGLPPASGPDGPAPSRGPDARGNGPASRPNGAAPHDDGSAQRRGAAPHEEGSGPRHGAAPRDEGSGPRSPGIDEELDALFPEPEAEQPVRPRIDSRSPVAVPTGRGRSIALAAVIALVVASIGVAAWLLRDRPEDLARPGPVAQNAEAPADGAKLNERVGGGSAPAPVPGTPPAAPARVDTSTAHRAVLYEEDPSNPQVPKVTAGRVTWKLDAVNAGQGQPLQSAVRATIEIPESGLTLNVLVRRNLDPTLPASHTVELTFTTRPGEPGRAVRDVGLLQFKPEMGGRGTPVAGLPVPVRDNLFLIGLSNLPADVERNTELMQRRNWIDLPVRSASGQRAIVSFEKGLAGDQVIRDAFQSWQ